MFYDFDSDPNPHTTDTFFGDTLSTLYGTFYNGTTTFGQLGVYETGPEIGDWNIGDGIPASAEFDSINVNVPDSGTTVTMLALGLLGIIGFGLRTRFAEA